MPPPPSSQEEAAPPSGGSADHGAVAPPPLPPCCPRGVAAPQGPPTPLHALPPPSPPLRALHIGPCLPLPRSPCRAVQSPCVVNTKTPRGLGAPSRGGPRYSSSPRVDTYWVPRERCERLPLPAHLSQSRAWLFGRGQTPGHLLSPPSVSGSSSCRCKTPPGVRKRLFAVDRTFTRLGARFELQCPLESSS